MSLSLWKGPQTLWNSLEDMEEALKEMTPFFYSPFFLQPMERLGLLEGAWSPQIDVSESRDNILVKADVPGMNKEDLDVSVHGKTLVIKGEKKHESETKGNGAARKERFYGYFNRTIPLSSEVDSNKVTAKYANGVLELTLPKKEEAKPKTIKVEGK